eukprot:CAMPEP_0174977378 /NCGR_PEP_ID=MMETSP0004_2-20121128/13572_1 /TAXON_ID=420556 /ORGANISM="Ochromonas sp., Strain CCMP1393" /LENGTH=798 /DNA_ID=CAMNT_0016228547 /DNA_START=56 /DNA_END=2452 /DNA_ORIENTATION=+
MLASHHVQSVLILCSITAKFLSAWVIQPAQTRSTSLYAPFGIRFKLGPRFSNDKDDNQGDSTSVKPKPKSENIDLFAVADRKPRIKAKSSSLSSSSAAIEKKEEDISAAAVAAKMKKINDIKSTTVGAQAEKLRLEAEKDQMEFEYERVEQQKTLLKAIDACLLNLVEENVSVTDAVRNGKEIMSKEFFFRLIELVNAEFTQEGKKKLMDLYDNLLEELRTTEPRLHTDITADIQKELKAENTRIQENLNKAAKTISAGDVASNDEVYDETLKQWMQQLGEASNGTASANSNSTNSLGGISMMDVRNMQGLSVEELNQMMANGTAPNNMADVMSGRTMLRLPAAMPINMIPLLLSSSEVSPQDLEAVRQNVFTEDILNNTAVDGSAYLTTFRGQPTVSAHETFRQANERIAALPNNVADRVRLFILPEYRILPNSLNVEMEKYSGVKYEPIFALTSKDAEPKQPGTGETVFRVVTLLLSAITAFVYATDVNSLNAEFVQRALSGDDSVVGRVLPIAGGLLGVQIVHDLGHYLMALFYQTRLSFPSLYWPSLQIGIYGSVTRFLSFPKTRRELFDVSIAGPFLGFCVSLWCTLQGLSFTTTASAEDLSTYPQLPSGFFKFSFLINELVDKFLHISDISDATANIPVHPLLAVGVGGLLSNALNFMPIGRLDGGRIAMAVAGRQSANGVTTATLLGQAVSLLTNSSPLTLYWLLAVVLLQRGADIPPVDDVTPVATTQDDANKSIDWWIRIAVLAFCVTLTAGILLPVPSPGLDPFAQQAATPSPSSIIQGVPTFPPNLI